MTDNKVTVEGLTGGKSYEFRVAAVNEISHGEYVQTKEACIAPSSLFYLSLSIFLKIWTRVICLMFSFGKFCFYNVTNELYFVLCSNMVFIDRNLISRENKKNTAVKLQKYSKHI